MSKFTREEIYNKLSEILVDDFEIEESLVKPEANLFEDLELDSIDAVDLAVKLQFFTNKKIMECRKTNTRRVSVRVYCFALRIETEKGYIKFV